MVTMPFRPLALLGPIALLLYAAATPEAAPAGTAPQAEPPPSAAQFTAGKQLFQNRCARCHGWNMVNLGSFSFDLRKFPRTDRARFFNSVTNGKNAMPAWKGVLSNEDIENVWAYVRSGGTL